MNEPSPLGDLIVSTMQAIGGAVWSVEGAGVAVAGLCSIVIGLFLLPKGDK